jgi:chromosome segregation ATPase
LLEEIAAAQTELDQARKQLADAKRRVDDAETQLINSKLTHEKLTEKYRRFKNQQVRMSDETKTNEADLDRFRQILPELLKKV